MPTLTEATPAVPDRCDPIRSFDHVPGHRVLFSREEEFGVVTPP
jgi:hypothetical protein